LVMVLAPSADINQSKKEANENLIQKREDLLRRGRKGGEEGGKKEENVDPRCFSAMTGGEEISSEGKR